MPDWPVQPVPSWRAPVAGRGYWAGDLRCCREGRRGARHHLHRRPHSVRGEAHLHGARHQNSRGWRQTKEMQTRPYLVEKRQQMCENFLSLILGFIILFLFILSFSTDFLILFCISSLVIVILHGLQLNKYSFDIQKMYVKCSCLCMCTFVHLSFTS